MPVRRGSTVVARWLYPFSRRGGDEGYYWPSYDGDEEPVSLEGYERLIMAESLRSDQWVLTTNYLRIVPGDYVYIYTGDDGAGIVGFGVVQGVSAPYDRRADLDLRIDFRVSKRLVALRPIAASVVRRWLRDQKRAVENLTGRGTELDSRLRNIPGYHRYLRRQHGH